MSKLRETSLFTKIANNTERISQTGIDRKNLTYFCSFMDNINLLDGISDKFEESFMQESDRKKSSDAGQTELELNDSL